MKLKLDENLGKTAAAIFQAGGYDTLTVPGQGLCRATDREVIAACQSERRCLVTLDLDFGNPLIFDPTKYSGIAVLRLPPKPSHQDLLDAAHTLTAALSRRDITGRLWIVQRGRIREYQGEDSNQSR
jgi:hypothetical protein